MVIKTATVTTDVFTALRALIVANKPTYVYDGTTFTYNLVSEYPRTNPTFPVVVLNKANISLALVNLDASGEDYSVEVQLDFYAKELHRINAIEAGQDGLRATFVGNIEKFKDTDGLIPMEDFWDDSDAVPFKDRNQVVHTGSSIVKFSLR